jgi:uncharacterized protein (TIGR00369 family)
MELMVSGYESSVKKSTEFEKVKGETISPTLSAYIGNIPAASGLEFCESSKGYVSLKLNYKPDLNNPLGIIYGGAIATLIDTAAVFTMYSDVDRQPKSAMTLGMNIQYLNAALGIDLIAHAKVLKMGKAIGFAQVIVEDPISKKMIAQGELSFSLSYQ